jgi:thymidylate kinase
MIQELHSAAPAPVLNATLVEQLAAAFEREAVVYSHWKSNIALTESAAGETDLDLLVSRESLVQALAILSQLEFKRAVARWGANEPGISHYYGLDLETSELVHVHLFSRVLTGESYVKSHLFPVDAMLLENAAYSGPLRVPTRPAELALFAMRMFIKYGSIPDLLSMRRKSASLRREVRWLQEGGEPAVAASLLRKHCPTVEEALFLKCVRTLDGDASLVQRVMLARQVRRKLKVYARHTLAGRALAYSQLMWAEAQRRRPGRKQKNKAPASGGAVIAFVGAEATGKSTLVAETGRWLGAAFAVRTVHAGKPPATGLTAPLSLLLPLMRPRLSSLRTNRLEGHAATNGDGPSPDRNRGVASLVYASRAVILAWERRQLLVRARRAAANGDIVICDRYPSDTVGAMDSPRLVEKPDVRGLGPDLFNRLARLERRIYQQIPPPDLVLRLRVSLETAQQRNRDRVKVGKESEAYVASRHQQAREWHRRGARRVCDVDTERPLAETIRIVKEIIWEGL